MSAIPSVNFPFKGSDSNTYAGQTLPLGLGGQVVVDTVVQTAATDRGGYTQGSVSAGAVVAPGTLQAPGDVITVAGGTLAPGGTAAQVKVATTQVVAASVANGGTGGTNGSATVTGTTGTGTKFTASVTIAGGVLTTVNSISLAGAYTANPTTLAAEPVTGGGLTGATLSLTMGIATVTVPTPGAYVVPPSTPAASASTTGSGTGATFTLTVVPIAFQVAPANASRRGYEIMNVSDVVPNASGAVSAGYLAYSSLATAVFAPSSRVLRPGDEYDSNAQSVSTGALSMIGSAIGLPFFSREF